MSTYSLKVKVSFALGSPNHNIERLPQDFALLCARHGGMIVESSDPLITTSYQRQCVNMVNKNHSIEKEVKRLKKRYHFPYVLFELIESKSTE